MTIAKKSHQNELNNNKNMEFFRMFEQYIHKIHLLFIHTLIFWYNV